MRGADLRKWRDGAGLSQSALAGWLGVVPNTVARWERDEIAIPSFLPLALVEVGRLVSKKTKENALQSYLLRVIDESWQTFQSVSQRAAKKGYQISPSYVMSIAQGRVTNPGILTIQAVAAGLNKPEDEIVSLFKKPKQKGKGK